MTEEEADYRCFPTDNLLLVLDEQCTVLSANAVALSTFDRTVEELQRGAFPSFLSLSQSHFLHAFEQLRREVGVVTVETAHIAAKTEKKQDHSSLSLSSSSSSLLSSSFYPCKISWRLFLRGSLCYAAGRVERRTEGLEEELKEKIWDSLFSWRKEKKKHKGGGKRQQKEDEEQRRRGLSQDEKEDERLREIEKGFWLESVNDVKRIWDLPNDSLIWEPSVQLLLGYPAGTLPPSVSWWRDRIHSDDRERVLHGLQRFLSDTGRFWCEEYRLLSLFGDYVTVIDQIHLHRDENGKPLRAICALFNPLHRSRLCNVLGTGTRAKLIGDIPLGRAREDELRYQTQLIKTITDNTASALFMMDEKGHPTFLNPAAERITGYKLEEIRDRPLHYAVHYKYPDGRPYPMEECPIDNSHAALVPLQNQEEMFVDKNGRIFPVVWSVAPVEKDGKAVGAVLEFRDVTEEKKAEKDRLEAKVEAKQQQIKAQEAETHKKKMTEFVDYVCHEIRNPLHGIVANTEFLRQNQVNLQRRAKEAEEKREGALAALWQELKSMTEYIQSIQECVSHQALITNNVLDLSRLEAGKVELDLQVFPLQIVVHQSVDILKGKIKEKSLSLETELSPDSSLLVKGDPTLLRQIFINLLSNAIKFTPPQGTITLSMESPIKSGNGFLGSASPQSSNYASPSSCSDDHSLLSSSSSACGSSHQSITVRAAVTDTGFGISGDAMEKLFSRFSQTNKKISSEYGGSGLGLSICYQITKLMNGSIMVESKPKKGTTFRFAVELDEPTGEEVQEYHRRLEDEEARKARQISSSSSLSSPSSRSSAVSPTSAGPSPLRSVLVAEDNRINQKIISLYLKNLGFAFEVVNNGKEALAALFNVKGEPQHDLVIMDLEMPVMDGRDATRRIREIERKREERHTTTESMRATQPDGEESREGEQREKTDNGEEEEEGEREEEEEDVFSEPCSSSSASSCSSSSLVRHVPIIALSGNSRMEQINEALSCGMDDYLTKPCKQAELQIMLAKWESFLKGKGVEEREREGRRKEDGVAA